jgi:hypothetical protein
MNNMWNLKRLKKVSLGIKTANYIAVPETKQEQEIAKIHPEIFSFSAISVGDEGGQAFIVPLDESSKETAELIIKALQAYKEG